MIAKNKFYIVQKKAKLYLILSENKHKQTCKTILTGQNHMYKSKNG